MYEFGKVYKEKNKIKGTVNLREQRHVNHDRTLISKASLLIYSLKNVY